MIFTKEVPKEPGLYWYSDTYGISVCELVLNQKYYNGTFGPMVTFLGWDITEPITKCPDMLWGDKLQIPTKELKDV
jgi:hypothetical protein